MNDVELEISARHIRQHILQMVYQANSGHLGGSLSAADVLTYLYFEEMTLAQETIKGIKRDRFVLSKGHASPLLYAVLAEKGFLAKAELTGFRKLHSPLQGHPNKLYVDGVDMSTGSLGQGISAAAGMALANQIDEVPYRIYTLLGDGECEEGEVWEAAMFAAHYKLDNLCAIVDFNGLQIDGAIRDVMNPMPIDEKFKAFGWHVVLIDGHDFQQIAHAFQEARQTKGKPTMILAHTIKGKGVPFMENQASWHGSVPNKAQYLEGMQALGGGDLV